MRAAGAVVAFFLWLASAQTAFAAADPYRSGEQGYDVSWPQCGKPAPAHGTFAIIGVNAGSPFTGNLCVSDEYAAAPGSRAPSLYINTGYRDGYREFVTSGCRQRSRSISGTSPQRMAWAIGCAESETSINYARAVGVDRISMWWLDVETVNRWSRDRGLNRYALQGAVSRLAQTGLPVGIYSSTPMWLLITGTLSAPGYVSAEWNAAGSCALPFTPLTRLPVWLAQHAHSDLDHDTAC